ncbi:YkgJ family cysteine cluster protein [Halosimplex pelagicum]|uniref:YkgJ family cysteine cluster protein n=1 Tax=Halosimplex pelagicum TaxID=869886 RepID=A0A7D5SUN2_9EURY|nr:YkgJ family cysteine cluster protein [Halosimplex pelagicum]QLH81487.1 YkgJ family cysteine cluster protein [Halosimplex pelagicum]
MEVNCEGCAGCCLDWRALAPDDADHGHERRGRYRPLDDIDNLAPVSSDEVRTFLDEGLAGALVARLFRIDDGPSVAVGGVEVAALGGRPAFLVGLRKVPKPVAPFGAEPRWLPTCAFLDPATLQCRVHDSDVYPGTCSTYPGDNLALDAETECERVERAHGGERLVDGDPPAGADPVLGPGAVGARVFAHPDAERVEGAVERLAAGEATRADHAEFVAVAAASSPGTLAVSDERYERARERALDSASWVDSAVAEWTDRADDEPPEPAAAATVEGDRGAPETPGWDD